MFSAYWSEVLGTGGTDRNNGIPILIIPMSEVPAWIDGFSLNWVINLFFIDTNCIRAFIYEGSIVHRDTACMLCKDQLPVLKWFHTLRNCR